MEQRINIHEKGQQALKPIFMMGNYLKKSALEPALCELVLFRVSLMNGCAYCLDMHYKDARAQGETEQRLYGLSTWRETPYYSERERAAFAWSEAVTQCDVSDAVYAEAKKNFSDQDLIDLTMVVANINTWNRINLAFPGTPGDYQVGQFG